MVYETITGRVTISAPTSGIVLPHIGLADLVTDPIDERLSGEHVLSDDHVYEKRLATTDVSTFNPDGTTLYYTHNAEYYSSDGTKLLNPVAVPNRYLSDDTLFAGTPAILNNGAIRIDDTYYNVDTGAEIANHNAAAEAEQTESTTYVVSADGRIFDVVVVDSYDIGTFFVSGGVIYGKNHTECVLAEVTDRLVNGDKLESVYVGLRPGSTPTDLQASDSIYNVEQVVSDELQPWIRYTTDDSSSSSYSYYSLDSSPLVLTPLSVVRGVPCTYDGNDAAIYHGRDRVEIRLLTSRDWITDPDANNVAITLLDNVEIQTKMMTSVSGHTLRVVEHALRAYPQEDVLELEPLQFTADQCGEIGTLFAHHFFQDGYNLHVQVRVIITHGEYELAAADATFTERLRSA